VKNKIFIHQKCHKGHGKKKRKSGKIHIDIPQAEHLQKHHIKAINYGINGYKPNNQSTFTIFEYHTADCLEIK
jgi:hypothetical protein